MLEHFAVAFAAHTAFDLSKTAVEAAFRYVKSKRPDLEADAVKAAQAGDPQEIERVFREAVGVILADAGTGALQVDGAVMTALKGIKFDHQHGQVTIGNSTISAAVLVTGGAASATGQTIIEGNTTLRSKGTEIRMGEGTKIVMTGGVTIVQK